jgi:hypothetical protein
LSKIEIFELPRRGARMKHTRLKATLTDSHLWIPLVVLAIGIGLLAAIA